MPRSGGPARRSRRFVLDRVGFDWAARERRADLAATMKLSALHGSSVLDFYSAVNGSSPGVVTSPRPLSHVSYRIGPDYRFERQARATRAQSLPARSPRSQNGPPAVSRAPCLSAESFLGKRKGQPPR